MRLGIKTLEGIVFFFFFFRRRRPSRNFITRAAGDFGPEERAAAPAAGRSPAEFGDDHARLTPTLVENSPADF